MRALERACIRALAEDVLGDAQKADRWLRGELNVLGGKSPLEIAQTDAGALIVKQILAKIDWGAAA